MKVMYSQVRVRLWISLAGGTIWPMTVTIDNTVCVSVCASVCACMFTELSTIVDININRYKAYL